MGHFAERSSKRLAAAVASIFGVGLFLSGTATALEAFDGRIQAHGFAEMQIRALNEKFEQQLDLAQWYNVLNVELEFDILPDGWGPIDLMSAFVRVEGRFDCIYVRGCGIFSSANAYGDRARRLPDRLADAETGDYGGVIEVRRRFSRNPRNGIITLDGDRFSGIETFAQVRCSTANNGNPGPSKFPRQPDGSCAPGDGDFERFTGKSVVVTARDGLNAGDVFDRDPDKLAILGFTALNGEIISSLDNSPKRGIFGALLDNRGADDLPGTDDDPFRYTMSDFLDFGFAFKNFKSSDSDGGRTQFLGPWLPKNFITNIGALRHKANPFRGRLTPSPGGGTAGFLRYHDADQVINGIAGAPSDFDENPYLAQPDIFPEELLEFLPPNIRGQAFSGLVCPPGRTNGECGISVPVALRDDPVAAQDFLNTIPPAGTLGDTILGFPGPNFDPLNNTVILTDNESDRNVDNGNTDPFGGDYSGIVPCRNATLSGNGSLQYGEQVLDRYPENGGEGIQSPGCLPRLLQVSVNDQRFREGDVDGLNDDRRPQQNVRVVGGTGELPLRPAPDIGKASDLDQDWDPRVAQGLYIPSAGLIKYLNEGDFDSLDMNFRESERAWNRGASQQDLKELKEAYVDIEVLDSRLWMRLGLQQIVWGKTELFRTTDQFNPVDLALASIPSLEESRIALIAGRFIYSLYEVGPLEDVRLEFAFNFDQVQPSDLGACGEPYTIDLVCSLTFGTFAHSYLGLGVAGIDRPASPWKDIGGLEIGGRIEWRWDRFSFALTDFYGYSDLPSIESIMTYERNVDILTGRPLVTRFNPENDRGDCSNANLPTSRDLDSVSVAGIGTDLDCLKFGRPFANDPQNALYNHHANQTIFAWVCSVTIGIASALDAGACAQTLFGSPQLLNSAVQIPFSELVTTLVAGEYRSGQFLRTIANAVSPSGRTLETAIPTQALNRDAFDGFITAYTGANMECFTFNPDRQNTVIRNQFCGRSPAPTQNGGINRCPTNAFGIATCNLLARLLPSALDFITLDSGLTSAQRAMLGCGPFWGTRCDTAAALSDFDCEFIEDERLRLLRSNVPPGQEPNITVGPSCTNRNFSLFGQPIFTHRDVLYDGLLPGGVQRGGGIDLLNLEGSALVQSWGGVEGTPVGYIATSMAAAPGTVNFAGGPVCTRYVPGEAKPIILPGCRGIDRYEIDPIALEVRFIFEEGYNPAEDGCLLGPMIGNHRVRMLDSNGNDMALDPVLGQQVRSCFGGSLPRSGDFDPNHPRADESRAIFAETGDDSFDPDRLFQPVNLRPCEGLLDFNPADPEGQLADCKTEVALFLVKANSDSIRGNYETAGAQSFLRIRGASTAYHPIAGCLSDANIAVLVAIFKQARCNFKPIVDNGVLFLTPGNDLNPDDYSPELFASFGHGATPRNFDEEFLAGTAQIFKNELGIVSYNFGLFLVSVSGCIDLEETLSNPACFDPVRPWALDRCSYNQWYHCSAIKGILGLIGVQRNVVKAGGNGRYGRRTLLWHGGQEVVLNYTKRNVFGFSFDMAEDVTKTNWGVEFTWFESVPFANNNEFDGTKSVDTLNLTVSVDRPTFINFLNANQTFFFNSQWFFRYVKGHSHGTAGDEWDVLFTFAMFTGYFQNRLNPSLITIYDFNSRSGGVLTSANYRFTEAFSATVGISFFFGRTELNDMGVNPIGPPVNRAGPNAYKDGGERFISNIRKRDEAFLRLRWTF